MRGSAHNTGDGIRVALDIGAQGTGQWDGCHATPIDVDAPATGDLQVTDIMPRRSYPIGVTVNTDGLRFIDEGASFAEQTFVEMGHAVLSQTDGIAHQIFDSRAQAHLEGRYTSARRVEADSVAGLAEKLGVDSEALERTIEEFKARPTALLRIHGHGRDNLHIRRTQDRHRRAGPEYGWPAHSGPVRGRDSRGRDIRPRQLEGRGPDARSSLWQNCRNCSRGRVLHVAKGGVQTRKAVYNTQTLLAGEMRNRPSVQLQGRGHEPTDG